MADRISGIYKITNTISGKYYMGSSRNIHNRWKGHKLDLRHNRHINPHLQHAWNKYGESAFTFEVTDLVPEKQLLDVESFYLGFMQLDRARMYNISNNAGGGAINYDKNVYNLINRDTKETFTGTQAMFKRQYGITDKQAPRIFHPYKNREPMVQGWMMQENYRNWCDKELLKEDLQLLNTIIKHIRNQLIKENASAERQEAKLARYKALGIVQCDEVNKVFIRACPSCGAHINHKEPIGLCSSAKNKRVCNPCSAKVISQKLTKFYATHPMPWERTT